ncbi:hypothetical protein [Paenibacillus protaetiae]|uniref:DUF2207 domain-containing protein n=1 Tax=Paenibacillus protaetiae TaxID=2509456 RepID=A0A4P6EVR5_9BACL|nr:hypothetical protein [Paenibacillus protaetiae]QAY66263.1 hypothetical protein ET464_07455 [Paenibacillus protaetiae]
MRNRWNAASVIVFALIAIGIVYSIISNPFYFIVPVVVLAAIFVLYKFPPRAFRRSGGVYRKPNAKPNVRQSSARQPNRHNRSKSKNVPFRVIDGGRDDDDAPRYH